MKRPDDHEDSRGKPEEEVRPETTSDDSSARDENPVRWSPFFRHRSVDSGEMPDLFLDPSPAGSETDPVSASGTDGPDDLKRRWRFVFKGTERGCQMFTVMPAESER